MISGLNPRKLVYRDGTSQSQRIIAAPDPDSIKIEERSLNDFLEFAARFAKYLHFHDEDGDIAGDWSGFLNGGLTEDADQQKWLNSLISYVESSDKVSQSHKGTPLSSPHLALFIAFLKLLDNIKVQVNDFTRKHLDLYYEELLSIDKKQPIPDVVNIIVQLNTDLERLLVPKGTKLMAGKDSEGKELIYETQKDTLISQAVIKNIKSLFIDKKVLGLREKRQKYFDRLKSYREIVKMALGYDTFDKDLSGKNLTDAALKYLLTEAELTFIVQSIPLSEEATDWERIYQTLETGYRRLLTRSKQQAIESPPSLFGLLQIIFGDRDGLLPYFNGNKVDETILDQISDLVAKKKETAENAQAIAYVTDDLMLSVAEFCGVAKSLKEKEITNVRWREIYITLETARSKIKELGLDVPQETEWKDIIAVNEINAVTNTAQGEHFKTFGIAGRQSATVNNSPVSLGMAITSPRLLMREGNRSIDVYITFNQTDEFKIAQLADAINNQRRLPQPFLFYISTSEGWQRLTEKSISFGNFLISTQGRPMPNPNIKNGVLTASGTTFSVADEGGYLVLQDGSVYRFDSVIDANSITVSMKGKLPNQNEIMRYAANEICLNALHVRFDLAESDPAVVAPVLANDIVKVQQQDPVLAFMLNDSEQQTTEVNGFNTWYQQFYDLTIAGVRIDLAVKDIKSLNVQNERAEYNPKKPFMPFGNDARPGNQLYFSHPEIAGKVIDSLSLSFNWMNVPKKLAEYYGSYRDVFADDMGGLNTAVANNETFAADLIMVDHGLSTLQNKINLFNNADASLENKRTVTIKWPKGGALDMNDRQLNNKDEVINQTRYFVLELKNDFKQQAYPTLVTRQALNYATLGKFVLNPPYVPLLKQLTAGYQASINIGFSQTESTGKLLHINPFGYAEPVDNTFMPRFEDQGELYIGLSGLAEAQNLSLLFQLAAGSADPDVQKPDLQWSYLHNNRWINFPATAILNDGTNKLLNTGLLELAIPGGFSLDNTLIGGGLYWLRATAKEGTAAIPDLVNVAAQGLSAIFINNNNAPDHLADPLKALSVKSTVDMLPGVKTIEQPFASMYGKAGEATSLYYARVSERLRHKNRALTMWDYERLVLDEFSDIYKVKCLPANFSGSMQDTGGVDVIVIPRVQKRLSFNNFQPKLAAESLLRIHRYLEARIPPFVTVTVKNPSYLQLRVRTAVRIKEGYAEAYYLQKLEDELKRFLAPWAYDEQAEIVIGGSIHHNVIVNFIAEKPYIDHVNTIKLLQSADGVRFRDVLDKNIKGEVSIADPNVILVSAGAHEIRLLTDEEFLEISTEGIGFMAVDVDFKISQDILNL